MNVAILFICMMSVFDISLSAILAVAFNYFVISSKDCLSNRQPLHSHSVYPIVNAAEALYKLCWSQTNFRDSIFDNNLSCLIHYASFAEECYIQKVYACTVDRMCFPLGLEPYISIHCFCAHKDRLCLYFIWEFYKIDISTSRSVLISTGFDMDLVEDPLHDSFQSVDQLYLEP